MKKGDKQHKKLVAQAGFHASNGCQVCFRHSGQSMVKYRHTNPNNLLKHLMSAHGYKVKSWWQFWR